MKQFVWGMMGSLMIWYTPKSSHQNRLSTGFSTLMEYLYLKNKNVLLLWHSGFEYPDRLSIPYFNPKLPCFFSSSLLQLLSAMGRFNRPSKQTSFNSLNRPAFYDALPSKHNPHHLSRLGTSNLECNGSPRKTCSASSATTFLLLSSVDL